MPSYFPEGDTPSPQDPIWRTLQKVNGVLYDLVGTLTTMPDYFPEGNAPAPQDTPGRSAHKILALCSALSTLVADVWLHGHGSPEGVVTADVGRTYVDEDNPGHIYVKTAGSGNTGWALNA